ncbi:glycoside hydrolase family protein [Filimonas effusa]|uniref:Uncharacterized protein n=1 Tax=Filimonas effusa TaxID=2508721 RepID=A0A4Q1DDK9_9BACT|nr:hypothetical protein [Filimonas effusa]RXK86965.1 hypothetical protein ESB13_09320 [Filimonas effusa]
MKRTILLIAITVCGRLFAQQSYSYLVEAEQFQVKGGWITESSGSCLGTSMLRVIGGSTAAADAFTMISVKAKGNYTVWVRSADYREKQGTRLFRLLVDEQPMEEAGKHGVEGFAWEKVGNVKLDAKEVLLRLKDTRKNFCRCDAVLLTSDAELDPNKKLVPGKITPAEIAAYRVKPVDIKLSSSVATAVTLPLVLAPEAPVIAEAGNDKVRIRFVKGGVAGNSIAAKTEFYINGSWKSPYPFYEDHKLYLLSSQKPALGFGAFYPGWNGSKAISYFMHDGKRMEVQEADDLLNPFMAGELSEAIPVEVIRVEKNKLEVKYLTRDGSIITGVWTVVPGASHVAVRLKCKAAKSGYYSMALAAFQGMAPERVSNILLPPMFQYKRLSPKPVMLVSAMMQQPLAIAETKVDSSPFSVFISGDTASFPLEWGSAGDAPMGFAIKNEQNMIQPVAFAPLLGQKDSKLNAGQVIEKDFVIGAIPAGWNDALEYISEKVYKVKDYRSQRQTSLTQAIFNIVDLLKNDDASGWSKELKGFYDIEGNPETAPTVVHCAPLALVATAVVSRDEDFYLQRSLPTIEYTLSRSGYRWATDIVPSGFNNTRKSLALDPFYSQFSTAYYEGLYRLLGEANPWLKEIGLPNGHSRGINGYAVTLPSWGQELEAYKLTGERKFLDAAKKGADGFLVSRVYSNLATPLGKAHFYNATMYAYWWDLLDLYEITNDDKYLKAAEVSAFHTIAGIRSVPQVKDSLQVIHPGNSFTGNTTLWWKGDKKYRLGFPRIPGDAPEKQVPQSLVSPVGLGFEQPFTYFDPGKTVRPVYMSSWAPHLLRLYQYTHRNIFLAYARNAVIGRFGNYPGYYATGFSDINMSDSFPYKGPDISSIYYHHIPPHLAFCSDFLVTEAIQRSEGKLSFPYVKQDGFVWFTNRIYGGGWGRMYNDKQVRLWMKKDLVSVDTPEINYITAISDSRFWVVLLSESVNNIPVKLHLSPETGVPASVTAALFSQGKNKSADLKMQGHALSVQLDAKGYAAVSFPLEQQSKKLEPIPPPVAAGMKIFDMGEPWGKVFLFRIRSPFGWDSIYGFAETAPIKGAAVSVSCNGQSLQKEQYPFEWSFYKLKADEDAMLRIKLQASDGTIKEQEWKFEGARLK